MGQGSRPERVADQIRAEVSSMIARDLRDPGLGFITITKVQVSPDLHHARVYYTALGSVAARKSSGQALERAAAFMRRQIGQRLHLRRAPELDFVFDGSIEHQDRIEQLLQELGTQPANPDERLPRIRQARQIRQKMTARILQEICEAILQRQRFVITSHARPDGDALGSQLAMAFALRWLGKTVRIVDHDPAPPQLLDFPGVRDIEVADSVDGDFDAALVMECGDLKRTGVTGLEKYFVINIDHHPGNSMYGAINWFDEGAVACGEMVFDLIEALGVPLTREIATHIYTTILTDAGGFHYGNITAKTFEISRRCAEAGVEPAAIASAIYDSSSLGRLKLMGAVLHNLELEASGRMALACMSLDMLATTGSTHEDSEGLINLPLSVKEIQAVAFFKEIGPDSFRVSMRSKGSVDVNRVAKVFGGGGHINAAGCSMTGPYLDVRSKLVGELCRSLTGC